MAAGATTAPSGATAVAAGLVQDALASARQQQQPLLVRGAGSRSLMPDQAGVALPALPGGVLSYDPAELVVTVLAGTRLSDLQQVLAERGQWLACEPPQVAANSTVGGAVASGWSGPGRPWNGALRDAVLGVELVNGLGEHLRFGGQVMKNVAGYDLSRLVCGSGGALGVLLAVSLRVWPLPPATSTVVLGGGLAEAAQHLAGWLRQPLPITATCWYQQQLFLRLAGSEQAVAAARSSLRGTEVAPEAAPWQTLRDCQHPFFAQGQVTRQSCAQSTALPSGDHCLVTWGGAERWFSAAAPPGEDGAGEDAVANSLQQRIRLAFDPDRLLLPATAQRPGVG